MSIIAEALKKAQKTSLDKKVKRGAEQRKSRRPPIKFDFSRLRIYLIYALSGAAIFFVILSLSLLRRTLPKDDKTTAEKPAAGSTYVLKADEVKQEEMAGPATILPAYITLTEVNEDIRVSGIMYTPKRPLVLINDSIWGEGDTVGKFKIIKIGRDFIKVDSNGQDFIVKLKR